MRLKASASQFIGVSRAVLATLALAQLAVGPALAASATVSRDDQTQSPIKHVIVIVGENRSFDHVFATYVPRGNQFVWNLLSEKIVNNDGSPGPNFAQATQSAATDVASDAFLLSPL